MSVSVSDDNHNQRDSDDLEELGDEIIIAQESAAHVPKPRANVATQQPTVVISEPPLPIRKSPIVPQMRRADRSEKTVVIRDRRTLDKLRKRTWRRRFARFLPERRTLYLVGVSMLAALAAGTLLATLLDAPESDSGQDAASAVAPATLPSPSVEKPPERVELDDLPLEKSKKKRRKASGAGNP